ncbi:MAG TPA: hypothetical protein VF668_09500 [Pyrinomonadaceae bacterium]|jgi:hypothetical protein
MISLLLKTALPFTLTFVVGAALGGLSWLFGGSEKNHETTLVTRTYEFKRGCGARRHRLVAETRPLAVLFKPDAWLPRGAEAGRAGERVATVSVTFGADGKVLDVKPLYAVSGGRDASLVEVKESWEAVERAARSIRFTPERVDGVPVEITKDVEISLRSY